MKSIRAVWPAAFLLVWPAMGCVLWGPRDESPPARPKPIALRIYPASEQPQEGHEPMRDEAGRPLYVASEPLLTEADVKVATVLRSDRRALLLLEFSPMATGPLEALSLSRRGERLAITLDDRLVMSPVLSRPIRDGRLILDGGFSPQRAEQIARSLNTPHATPIGHTP